MRHTFCITYDGERSCSLGLKEEEEEEPSLSPAKLALENENEVLERAEEISFHISGPESCAQKSLDCQM